MPSLSARIKARCAARRGDPVPETATPKVAEKVAEKPKKKKGLFGRKK